jgi:hypothetical protein
VRGCCVASSLRRRKPESVMLPAFVVLHPREDAIATDHRPSGQGSADPAAVPSIGVRFAPGHGPGVNPPG